MMIIVSIANSREGYQVGTEYWSTTHFIDTRALFERALAVMPNEKASSIWRKFADYENKYGDMSGIERVERRWREAFPSGAYRDKVTTKKCEKILMTQLLCAESKLSIFVDRNSYLNIQVIKDLELGGKGMMKSHLHGRC